MTTTLLRDVVARAASTYYPAGTCAMGPGPDAVVQDAARRAHVHINAHRQRRHLTVRSEAGARDVDPRERDVRVVLPTVASISCGSPPR